MTEHSIPVNIDAGGTDFEEGRGFIRGWVNPRRVWVTIPGMIDGHETWRLPLINASIVYEEG